MCPCLLGSEHILHSNANPCKLLQKWPIKRPLMAESTGGFRSVFTSTKPPQQGLEIESGDPPAKFRGEPIALPEVMLRWRLRVLMRRELGKSG